MIRKIKANYAIEDGAFLIITKRSKRLFYFILSFIILVLLGLIFLEHMRPLFIVICSLLIAVFISHIDSGKEVRKVPLADLVEIKRYVWPPKVTVVLDDERAKMGKSGIPPLKGKKVA